MLRFLSLLAALIPFNSIGLDESVKVHRAVGVIEHRNAEGKLLSREVVRNVKTKAGIDYTFDQTYDTAAKTVNYGLSYIGLSNDTVTEDVNSTTLTNEITLNGLGRAKGTYAHTPGASTCTIAKTFTATGSQSCQKAALFSYSSGGSMHHVLSFTQRNLVLNDTITITFTITLS